MLPRNRSVKALLPAGEEVVFSTRGQALPILISQLSSSLGSRALTHRGSFFVGPDDVHDLENGGGGRTSGESERQETAPTISRRASWFLPDAVESSRPGMEDRRRSEALLYTPQMRSLRLIGHSNPRYRWEQYWTTEEELKKMKKPLRQYYERNNSLIQQYVYIDRLLDSSLPHDLIQEYQHVNTAAHPLDVPSTISEESPIGTPSGASTLPAVNSETSLTRSLPDGLPSKIKRTPKNLYKVHERTPLLSEDTLEEQERTNGQEGEDACESRMPQWEPEDDGESDENIVTVAIYVNLVANTILLILKIIATLMTSSVSVLAALVDAVLDFLSTAIVWTTTRLISAGDDYQYPIGRRRLEPIGVLVFSVIMITAFAQVGFAGIGKLTDENHTVVELGTPAIVIMLCTVLVKGLCWMWCRLIKNSSVQALAQDAVTDVVFNTFSIIFPLSKLLTSVHVLLFMGFANVYSRVLRQHLVARSCWRYITFLLRHLCLVPNHAHTHSKPNWCGLQRRRAQCPFVSHNALCQDDKADSGIASLPCGRSDKRRG
jgi:hypothetical protein